LADQLTVARRYLEAEAAYSALLESSPGSPDVLLKRGSIRLVLGRFAEARADLEAAVAAQRPPGLATAYQQLGVLEQIQGRNADAIQHHRLAIPLMQEFYGPRDPGIGVSWNRLGEAYLTAGSMAKAEEALAQAIAILTPSTGYQFHLCLAHTNLGRVLLEQSRYIDAARSFEQARRSNTGENGCAAMIASGLGRLYYAEKDFPRAEASFRESIDIGRSIWPNGHATTAFALQGLALTAAACHRFAEARELFQQALEMDERVLGPAHPNVREVLLDLAGLLRAAHRGREARRIGARIRRDFPASLDTISLNTLAGR
jgi:tetratricopeptide (TPR) repeat protein